MRNKTSTLIFIALFAVLMAGAYLFYTNLKDTAGKIPSETENGSLSGTAEPDKVPAADFTVFDGEGNPRDLSDFSGSPVILNFWASWCHYCKLEMPDFEEAFAQYGDDVVFMMIDVADGKRETRESGQAYIDENGYTFPVYFDTGLEAASAYNITGLPTTVFIDADGNIAKTVSGAQTLEKLTAEIDKIAPGTD